MTLYQRFDVDEETPVQFLGVYTTRWRPEWGAPEAMFREYEEFIPTDEQRAAYPVEEWQHEVARGGTLMGYDDWVQYRVEVG